MIPQPEIINQVYEWLKRIIYILWLLYGQNANPPVPPPNIPSLPAPPPAEKPRPKPEKTDVKAAIIKITSGNSMCTATVIRPRFADGRWPILTAAHCVRGVGASFTARFKDGKNVPGKVVYHSRDFDLAWGVIETREELDSASVSPADPSEGTPVWHMGYGVDRPGNLETGRVLRHSPGGTTMYTSLAVSSGDSGSGVFRSDTNELVGVVSGYSGRTNISGSCRRVRETRPASAGGGGVGNLP